MFGVRVLSGMVIFAGLAKATAAFGGSPYDLVTEPTGVLSDRELHKLWDAVKTVKTCFAHPVYGKATAFKFTLPKPDAFTASAWKSPFTNVHGSPACAVAPASLAPPKPMPTVNLDEGYGQRQADIDSAAKWFRRMATYVRLSNDPVARSVLRQGVVEWAKGKSLTKGIHVSWGTKPVDYQMMATIMSVLTATGEVAADFSPEERAIVGPWLGDLLKQTSASTWGYREDNKAFMRSYMALLWGLMIGDDKPVQEAIFTYKLAIHDMRPDGSWPVDSERSGMGLHYDSAATGHLVLIATVLKQVKGIDLFSYAVDGRSIHDSVAFVVSGIVDPVTVNQRYAISCPDGGDRFGTPATPAMFFIDEGGGYLLVYAAQFPDRESAHTIVDTYKTRDQAVDSEKSGGAAACQFATVGGDVNLEPLKPLAPSRDLIAAKYVVRASEEAAYKKGGDIEVNSDFLLQVENNPKLPRFEFSVLARANAARTGLDDFSVFLGESVKPSDKLNACGDLITWPDGTKHALLRFLPNSDRFVPVNADCLVAALPRQQAAMVGFLAGNFSDIAVGIVEDGSIEGIQSNALRAFLRSVAVGEVSVGH